MSKKRIGSRHTHEQSVLAQEHDRTSFEGVSPGRPLQPKHISDFTGVRLVSTVMNTSHYRSIA
jgi:hypothetical protein